MPPTPSGSTLYLPIPLRMPSALLSLRMPPTPLCLTHVSCCRLPSRTPIADDWMCLTRTHSALHVPPTPFCIPHLSPPSTPPRYLAAFHLDNEHLLLTIGCPAHAPPATSPHTSLAAFYHPEYLLLTIEHASPRLPPILTCCLLPS